MTLRLPPHTQFKESGLPWLGEIPAHWEVRRNGRLFAQRNEVGFSELPILEVSLKTGVRVRDFDNPARKQVMEDRDKYKRAAKGDLAYNMMRMWQGAVGLAPVDGLVSPAYVVARPLGEAHAAYFDYLFRTAAYMAEVDKFSRGIVKDRNRLYWDDFKRMPSAFPPPDEQRAISQFLDEHARRVRHFILAKLRLVDLLNEQKHVITYRAVTRGLDLGVPTKPFGSQRPGEVPEHWTVTRVKSEATCLNSRRIPLSGVERGRMTNRSYDYYGASGVIDKVDDYLFDDDLILIAEDGANLALRNLPLAIIARGRFWVNNHAHILKPKRANLEYLASVLESVDYKPWISGAAQPKLTKDRLMAIPIAVPAVEEQEEIVAFVRKETESLDSVIIRELRQVELLREYRSRLIADVVTGKLDVRGSALPQSKEIDPHGMPCDGASVEQGEMEDALEAAHADE